MRPYAKKGVHEGEIRLWGVQGLGVAVVGAQAGMPVPHGRSGGWDASFLRHVTQRAAAI
jgi:hypothetical protein